MNGTIAEREALWDAFLHHWPLDTLPALTLDQYSRPGQQDGFTYWLEKRTEKIGSIWGGSSFKFGVYVRADKKPMQNAKGRCFSDTHGWLGKYGVTPQEAFGKVRTEIVKVANAARAGNLAEIDGADLGDAIKWKIAFLYQDRDRPGILPVFKAEFLRLAAGSNEKTISRLHASLLAHRDGVGILAYGDEIWQKIQPLIRNALTPQEALEFFRQAEGYRPVKDAVQNMAGFESNSGWQLVLDLDNASATIYARPGKCFDAVEHLMKDVVRYPADRRRSSNLAANAPQLALGNPIIKFVVPDMQALVAFSEAYDSIDDDEPMVRTATVRNLMMAETVPLNQILFGPPGTGKTYATIDAALKVLDPDFLEANYTARTALKERFDALAEEGRIRFVTFHQSFSYEDFVEGLRAQSNDKGEIEYRVEDGVFKQLCDAARTWTSRRQRPEIGENPRIWKISIDGTGPSPIRQYCLEHGEARIGWETGDLREGGLQSDYVKSLGSNDLNTVRTFYEDIVPGDILVCIRSATEIGAVGVVTGAYWYDENPNPVVGDWRHVLPVRWLYKDLHVSILPLNDNTQFTQKTVYPLNRFKWGDLVSHLEQAGVPVATSQGGQGAGEGPHALIIDEINRGNVSRIFGELITLIEESKRETRPESIRVQLPYSKRPFSVPDNVYIIGTMNTADRSLAGLDIALRRRFEFVEMPPRPELLDGVKVEGVDIGQMLRTMNERIEVLLDRDHRLGHAYFMPLLDGSSLPVLARIFRNSVLPLLQEYFFEDWQRIAWVLNDHRKLDGALRFLIEPASDLPELLGPDVAVPSRGRRWALNTDAFDRIGAYAGILAAGGTGGA